MPSERPDCIYLVVSSPLLTCAVRRPQTAKRDGYRSSWLNSELQWLVAFRPPRLDSVEHALYAYVFDNLWPAYPRTGADDLES